MVSCNICQKNFKNEYALRGHSKIHKSKYLEQQKIIVENIIQRNVSYKELRKTLYNDNPIFCANCDVRLSLLIMNSKALQYI